MENGKSKNQKRLRDARFREVHRVWGQTEADVIKSFLDSQGIPCILQGQIVHSLYPFSADGLGEIKILVPEENLEEAKKLLEIKE
jgi:hypothetical protein